MVLDVVILGMASTHEPRQSPGSFDFHEESSSGNISSGRYGSKITPCVDQGLFLACAQSGFAKANQSESIESGPGTPQQSPSW